MEMGQEGAHMQWLLLFAQERGGVLEGAMNGAIRGAIIGGVVGALFGGAMLIARLFKKKDEPTAEKRPPRKRESDDY
jgi:hypothetical protein